MAKNIVSCPFCKKEIGYLQHYQNSVVSYEFKLDKKGIAKYGDAEIVTGEDSEWCCPECSHIITFDEDKAVAFLKGKKLSKR